MDRRTDLSPHELLYARLLREVKPTTDGHQRERWRDLMKMIREDWVRPNRWDRFNEICERGD